MIKKTKIQNINEPIMKELINEKVINLNQYIMCRNLSDTTGKEIEEIMLEKGFIKEKKLYEVFSKHQPAVYGGILPNEIKKISIKVERTFEKLNKETKDFSGVLFKIPNNIWEQMISNPKNIQKMNNLGFTEKDQFFVLTNEPFNLAKNSKIIKMKASSNNPNLKVFFLPSKEYKETIFDTDKKYNFMIERIQKLNSMDLEDAIQEGLVENFLNTTLEYSIEYGASDIHIEPDIQTINFRIRKDGVLEFLSAIKKEYADTFFNLINSRTKDNNIDSMKPLDGQFNVDHEILGSVNMRWGENRTIYGHHIVIRILNSDVQGLTLDNINYTPHNLKLIKKVLKEPNGIILITGPTGSGKTNTLAAVLKEISKPETKILSLEDPVEIKLPIIQQVQVQPKAKLTVQAGLKSFLRQDPDIMFIGEIRDGEMAKHAVEGAMTGHLMLATLHTNDSLSSIIRLKDIGIETGHIANTLKCVIAQRLLRKLCNNCKEKVSKDYIIENENYRRFNIDENEEIFKHKTDGCPHCNFSGYSGRSPVAEIFIIDKFVQNLILKDIPLNDILDKIKEQGFTDLQDNGLDMVKKGITDIDEIIRVLGTNTSEQANTYK